jgi:hypothetical protein
MLTKLLWSPLAGLAFLFGEFESQIEAAGAAIWLFVIGWLCALLLSVAIVRLVGDDPQGTIPLGIEARIRIAWAIAYAILAIALGAWACVTAFKGLREMAWGGLLFLWPYLAVAALFAFFSRLVIAPLERRS